MWLNFQCKSDYSMANHGTQEIPSPVKLVSMKFFDAREMKGEGDVTTVPYRGLLDQGGDSDVAQISMKQ